MADLEVGNPETKAPVQLETAKSKPDDQHPVSDTIWPIYCTKAREHDKPLMEGWRDDMEGILIFAGLFSGVITAFLLESYKKLQPDSGDLTVAILAQISQQLAATSNGSNAPALSPSPELIPFIPTTSAVHTNLLWFLSLSLSLITAFGAILVKQWVRIYLETIERAPIGETRGRVREFLFGGLESFGIPLLVTTIPTLLHIALFLFLGGLFEFLHPVNSAVSYLILAILMIMCVLYAAIAILPVFYRHCPYHMPLLDIIVSGFWTLRLLFFYCIVYIVTARRGLWKREIWLEILSKERRIRGQLSVRHAAMNPSIMRDKRDVAALYWVVGTLQENAEIEPFLKGLPDFFTTLENEKCDLIGAPFDDLSILILIYSIILKYVGRRSMSPEQVRRSILCLTAYCALLNHLAANKQSLSSSSIWILKDLLQDAKTGLTIGPARCVVATVMCHYFREIDNACAEEHSMYYSYMLLGPASEICGLLPGEHAADWTTRVEQFPGMHRNSSWLVPVKDARLLALIDCVITLMECPPIPADASQALPLVLADFTPCSQDPGLQRLFVQTLRRGMQPRVLDDGSRTTTNLPLDLVDHLMRLLDNMTDAEAVEEAKEVVALRKSLQPKNPSSAENSLAEEA